MTSGSGLAEAEKPPNRVLITGVSKGGLGFAIAKAFASEGASVAISDQPNSAQSLGELRKALCEFGNVVDFTADISNQGEVDDLVGKTVAALGGLDVLVNNAGVMLRKSIFDMTLSEWQHVLDVNLTGAWLMCRAAGRHLVAQRRGRIVNISSVYADRVGRLPESSYYASKAGVANLTRALAQEFGPSGVTVNCVAPGVFYPTSMTAPLGESPETLEAMTQRTMLGRLGDPGLDMHGLVTFLSSPAAGYITGQTIFVDGGWSAW